MNKVISAMEVLRLNVPKETTVQQAVGPKHPLEEVMYIMRLAFGIRSHALPAMNAQQEALLPRHRLE